MNIKKSFLILLVIIASNSFSNNNEKAIKIADSVARMELKKTSNLHPTMLSEGQLSLIYYDKTISIDHQKDGTSYTVFYSFNQPILGKVLFQKFKVVVNFDSNYSRFIAADSKIYSNAKNTTSWPKDLESLIKHLNTWDKKELENYENHNKTTKTSGETNAWIEEHKKRIHAIGGYAIWDNYKKEYYYTTQIDEK